MWEGVWEGMGWDQDVGPKTHNLRMPAHRVTSSDKQAAGCGTACPTDQVLLSSAEGLCLLLTQSEALLAAVM